MKKALVILLISVITWNVSAQFVAKMEVKEDIPGLCDKNEVYVLFPSFKGQKEAICPLSEDELSKRLNSEIAFLKDKPTYQDKGMIGLVINCKGALIKCEMDNKTQSPELDQQIVAIFNSLVTWKAGKLNGKPVDSSQLFSFEIKDGVIILK